MLTKDFGNLSGINSKKSMAVSIWHLKKGATLSTDSEPAVLSQ